MQQLANVQVVLVEPAHPGNIGATARAMANMGLSQLVLVNPKQFPHESATARAAGADFILDNARVCQSIDEALSQAVFVLGTTARSRRTAWPVLTPRPAMAHVSELLHAGQAPVAICFGRERTGLTNDELERCHALIWIPVDAQFSSLNLGSAATVILYELRHALLAIDENLQTQQIQQRLAQIESQPLATAQMLRDFYAHLETVLVEIDFFDGRSSKLLRKFTRLFNRAYMTDKEVSMLRGVLSEVQRQLAARSLKKD